MGNWLSKLLFGDSKPDPDSKNEKRQNSGKSSLSKAIIKPL